MKIITIGRSSGNDVCINDPYVGRRHCQIMQYDNGTYAIVDLGSTNGTFVNGNRIFGVARLQPYDSVTIGHTTLPWMSYFPSVLQSPKSKSYALPIVLGSVGGVLLTIVLTLLIFRHGPDKAFAFKGEYPDAVVVNMVNEDGTPYTIEAVEGQVCVWFDEGVSYKTAQKSIKALGGRIVAQIPENGYYLVEVPAEKVQIFLKRIAKENFVDWAYPNMISYPCIAKNYILDNFYPDKSGKNNDDTPHGVIVQFAMQQCGSGSPLDTFNIGTKNGKSMKIAHQWHVPMSSTDNLAFATSAIASSSDSGPIIINMSFGPYLRPRKDSVRYYWEEATLKEKEDYQERYLNTMRIIIENVRKLKDKDYIIVKSAGNNGVKVFDTAIISYLRKNLEPDELEIMDKHFVIVAAGEKYNVDRYSKIEKDYKDLYDKAVRKKDQELMIRFDTNWRNVKEYVHSISTYSNEMERGHYDPWVTKVDISDFEFHGKHVPGTSIAAPRAACILSSVANEMNLTGAEVLKLARETTQRDGELTKGALLQKAMDYKMTSSKHNEPSRSGMSTTGGSSAGGSSSTKGSLSTGSSPSTGSSSSTNGHSSSGGSSSNGGSSAGHSSSTGGSSLPSENSAEKAARRIGAAMCSGDASTIRSLTTDEMYEEIMETFYAAMELVDENTRQLNRKKYLESPVETLSIGKDRVVVRFGSDGPQIDFYMMKENGKWIMYDFAQGGVHISKDMRKRMRQNQGY